MKGPHSFYLLLETRTCNKNEWELCHFKINVLTNIASK